MTSIECLLEVMEQPAERVKFRTEVNFLSNFSTLLNQVHGHRCQQRELLLGQTVMPDEMVAFPKVRLVPKPGQSLRSSTLIRISLVDIRSSSENIIDHWHRLVDCREETLSPKWSVVRPLELPYGWVTFSNLGVVRSLERERGGEVGERAVLRAEERIGSGVRADRHQQLELRDRAEARCRETCAFRLKLCFEAFIPAQDGTIVQVAEPVFSENILDESRPDKAGDLPVEKISVCSDVVEGGQEVMAFTGNKSTKIPLRQSNFFVEFFELGSDGEKVWKSGRIEIPKCDLHELGQILGGLSFKVPVFDRESPGRASNIEQPTQNVFFEIVKTNKAGKEEAKSDPIIFTYNPSRLMTTVRKRGQAGSRMFETKLPKMDPNSTFVPTFTYSLSEPTVTITNLPITGDPRIPTLVESIRANLDSSGGDSSLQGGHLGGHDYESKFNALSPATGLSHLQINSPQELSPNPSAMLLSSASPQRTVSPVLPPNCPPSSPYMQRIQHNQEESQNQQALNEQNINDFIKSILAPDSPGRLSDLGSNIFFDGSTRTAAVCSDSVTVSEAPPPVGKTEDSKEEDKETKDNNLVICRKEGSKEGLHREKEEITESLQKLDIAQ